MIEQSLGLQMNQKVVMNMQMQQAVKILQLSAQEMQEMVENEFAENPLLDYEEKASEPDNDTAERSLEEIKKLAEYLDDTNEREYSSREYTDDERAFEIADKVRQSLREVLEEQASWNFKTASERNVAFYLIGSLNDSGYLTCTIEDAARECQQNSAVIKKVLGEIQLFEPIGCGAENLQACLTVQAEQLGIYQGVLKGLIDECLPEIAAVQFKKIAAKLECSMEEVQKGIDLLRTLNPRPGMGYDSDSVDYIVPDAFVRKIDGVYVIKVNEYSAPRLRINSVYRNAEVQDEATRKYLNQQINSAAWLIRNIEQRRSNLYRVVEFIVKYQQDYLEKGISCLKPLRMKDIAEEMEVHESTVSRVVANKYVDTPQGVVSMKSFFGINLAKADGEEVSTQKVKLRLKALIEAENQQKPLSDQKLTELMLAEGFPVSRRTVMKYREQLGFNSSVKRKRYS